MSTLEVTQQRSSLPLALPRLPSWAPALVGVIALCASGLLALLAGWGIAEAFGGRSVPGLRGRLRTTLKRNDEADQPVGKPEGIFTNARKSNAGRDRVAQG